MLLRELLFLDVELNRDRGGCASPEEYKARFPEAADDIDAAFAEGLAGPVSFGRGDSAERARAISGVHDDGHGVPSSSAG